MSKEIPAKALAELAAAVAKSQKLTRELAAVQERVSCLARVVEKHTKDGARKSKKESGRT